MRAPQKIHARDALRKKVKDDGFDFENLTEKQRSSHAIKFYLKEIYGPTKKEIPEDEIDSGIIDGANDLGCDFFHRDSGRVLIIQAKYRGKGSGERSEDITHFQAILKRFASPNLKANKMLEEALSDINWKQDRFELIYLTFGEIKNQAKLVSESPPDYPSSPSDLDERCTWEFLGSEEINIAYRYVENIRKQTALNEEIDIFPVGPKGQKGASTVVVVAGNFRSFIMSLDAPQIIEVYQKAKRDSLFSLNIRNYIGDSPINKKISQSALEDSAKFFLFNNGISCLATEVIPEEQKLRVRGLQVINGAQTVKSLFKAFQKLRREQREWPKDNRPQVLVRITEVPGGYGESGRVREQIIRANNTQNSIRDSDFRSNDDVQESLVGQFEKLRRKNKNVAYIRKRTEKTPGDKIQVKLEEFAKSIYAFMYDPTDFSGNSDSLFLDSDQGYYRKIFGDGDSVWDRMPEKHFRYRAAIYWIAQEAADFLKDYRANLNDADERAALERKWLFINAIRMVIQLAFLKDGEPLEDYVARFAEGDWGIQSGDPRSEEIKKIFRQAVRGVIFAYKNDKKHTPSFVHRNWMRGKNTTQSIREAIKAIVES
jgi:hypothetical protein